MKAAGACGEQRALEYIQKLLEEDRSPPPEGELAENTLLLRIHRELTALKGRVEALEALNKKLQGEAERRNSTVEALQERSARFQFLASHDPLTGILNRRSFIEKAGFELRRAAALSLPCCLGMMDIDNFKQFNDTYGHLAGDEALRHVVNVTASGLRKNDFAGRYGGEEFVLFFYDTCQVTGGAALDRIRRSIAETPVILESGAAAVYASFGAAETTPAPEETGKGVRMLISRADTALYAAKKAGKNRVALYDPAMEGGGP